MADNTSTSSGKAQQVFKIIFYNDNELFEVYARQIFNSDLYGFIEIEELLFGEKTQIVVDPSEEKLKAEFAGVKRSYIPQHSIVRIDEVEKLGVVRVSDVKTQGNVATFPVGGNLK
ncbi:MAG: DUF1820 family protein [Pseudomonadales bacterium]|nr:DUF1820 family protein [Pseudomonadales bacterium]